MYRCQKCGVNVPSRTRILKQVMETREKIYPHRPKVFRVRTEDQKSRWRDDVGGRGHETVREINVCPSCFEKAEAEKAAAEATEEVSS